MSGIKVPGVLVPGTVKGVLTEAKWIKGTYIAVATEAERDTIPEAVLVPGSKVFVAETGVEYFYSEEGDWEEGSPNAIPDAPKDGLIYGRQDGKWVEITFDPELFTQQFAEIRQEIDAVEEKLTTEYYTASAIDTMFSCIDGGNASTVFVD